MENEQLLNIQTTRQPRKLLPIGKEVAASRKKFELTLVRSDDLLLREQAKSLVQEVAVLEKGWPVGDYIDRFQVRSKLWVVRSESIVVGTVLVIEGDPETFPIRSCDAWPNLQTPSGNCAEIPFVVVAKNFRGSSGVSHILCAACHWYFHRNQIDYMELTLDKNLFDFYIWHGMEMQPISEKMGGGEKCHWGESGIFPARLFVGNPNDPESMGAKIQQKRPEMWKIFLKYKG